MCLQKFPPVCRFSKICHWTVNLSYLHVLPEILPPPSLQIFPKSATGQFPKLPTCAYRNPPWGADFPKSATGQLPKLPTCACRNSPPVCRFYKICHWTDSLHVLAEIPPQGCRCSKICNCSVISYQYVLAEIVPQFVDFPKSATGQLPTVLAEIPHPSLKIFQNLPLDSYLSYLYMLAEIPP